MPKNNAPQAPAPANDSLAPWLDRIHTGDCLDLLPGLPSGSVDTVFADLPYGVSRNAWHTVIRLPTCGPS